MPRYTRRYSRGAILFDYITWTETDGIEPPFTETKLGGAPLAFAPDGSPGKGGHHQDKVIISLFEDFLIDPKENESAD